MSTVASRIIFLLSVLDPSILSDRIDTCLKIFQWSQITLKILSTESDNQITTASTEKESLLAQVTGDAVRLVTSMANGSWMQGILLAPSLSPSLGFALLSIDVILRHPPREPRHLHLATPGGFKYAYIY